MQFFSEPVFKKHPFLWVKNDIYHRRIAGRKHSIAKPDPDQQEKNVPGFFFVVEFISHMEKILLYWYRLSYRFYKFR